MLYVYSMMKIIDIIKSRVKFSIRTVETFIVRIRQEFAFWFGSLDMFMLCVHDEVLIVVLCW